MAGMSPLDSKSPVALVIHGGAGVSSRESISAADQFAIRHDLDLALDAG